jgi:hypothetical protein
MKIDYKDGKVTWHLLDAIDFSKGEPSSDTGCFLYRFFLVLFEQVLQAATNL